MKTTTTDRRSAADAARTCRHEAFPGGRNEAFRVYFTPEVHAALWKHGGEDTSVEICGVLVGHLASRRGRAVRQDRRVDPRRGGHDQVRRGDVHPPDLGQDQRRDGHQVRRHDDRRLVSHAPRFRHLPLRPRSVHPGAFLLRPRADRARDRPGPQDRGRLHLAAGQAGPGGAFLGRGPDPARRRTRSRPAVRPAARPGPRRGGRARARSRPRRPPTPCFRRRDASSCTGGVFLLGYLLSMPSPPGSGNASSRPWWPATACRRCSGWALPTSSTGSSATWRPPARRSRPPRRSPSRRTRHSATSAHSSPRTPAGREHQGAVRHHAGRRAGILYRRTSAGLAQDRGPSKSPDSRSSKTTRRPPSRRRGRAAGEDQKP